jgi:hypothetical protein
MGILKRFLLSFFLILLFAIPSFAANKHIRVGASGTGSGDDWTNAYASFAAATAAGYSRSNTYYVAGGTYSENPTIACTIDGTNWLVVKKATVADHGSATGWNDSYGTDQAVIAGRLWISNAYTEIDGQVGFGTSGYGIKIYCATAPSSPTCVLYINNTLNGPIHFYHLDICGPGFDYGSGAMAGIYFNGANSAGIKGVHVRYCYIHEIPQNGCTWGAMEGTSYSDYGMLYEDNVMERTGGLGQRYPNLHGQGMQVYQRNWSYIIFRNNVFHNIAGNAYVSILSTTSPTNYLRFYNNVIYADLGSTYRVYGIAESPNTSSTAVYQTARDFTGCISIIGKTLYNTTKGTNGIITSATATLITCSGGMTGGVANEPGDEFYYETEGMCSYRLGYGFYNTSGNTVTNIELYNNTTFNESLGDFILNSQPEGNNNVSRNNMWTECRLTNRTVLYPTTISNNGFYNNVYGAYVPSNTESSDPFNSSTTYDFSLKSTANAVNSGYDLSSIFTTDIIGATRSGGFDIGAYEYTGADVSPPVISGILPTGTYSCSSNPYSVTEQITTNEAATCRADDTSSTWSSMSEMSTTGGTTHSRVVSRACGSSWTPHYKCQDAIPNESGASSGSYSIGAAPDPPAQGATISNIGTGKVSVGPSSTGRRKIRTVQ